MVAGDVSQSGRPNRRFPHYAPHDDYEFSEGHILTFLSGAHRDISNGRQQRDCRLEGQPGDHTCVSLKKSTAP